MSGIEIAGLVLAAYPVLVQACQGYKQAFEPLREWYNFKRVFDQYLSDIRNQHLAYRENIEILLSPVVSSQQELNDLLEEHDIEVLTARWKSDKLQDALQIRLAHNYSRYMEIMLRMQQVKIKLEHALCIKDGKVRSR